MCFECVFLNSGMTGLTPKYYFPKPGEGGITPALLSWYKIEAGFELRTIDNTEKISLFYLYFLCYLLNLLFFFLSLIFAAELSAPVSSDDNITYLN